MRGLAAVKVGCSRVVPSMRTGSQRVELQEESAAAREWSYRRKVLQPESGATGGKCCSQRVELQEESAAAREWSYRRKVLQPESGAMGGKCCSKTSTSSRAACGRMAAPWRMRTHGCPLARADAWLPPGAWRSTRGGQASRKLALADSTRVGPTLSSRMTA